MGESDSLVFRLPRVLVAIDVDSTLHDYWEQFRVAALELHGVHLPYEEQTDWGVQVLSRPQVAEVIEHTHRDEQVSAGVPYSGAADVINAWRRDGHTILITTHRRPDAHDITAQWLTDHGFGFDLLRCGYQKVDHCQEIGADVLIDDSPINIRDAIGVGITAATIAHPWNRGLADDLPAIVYGDDWADLAKQLALRHPELQLTTA